MDELNPYESPRSRELGDSSSTLPIPTVASYILRGAAFGAVGPAALIGAVAVVRLYLVQPLGQAMEFSTWEELMALLLMIYGTGAGAVIGWNRFLQLMRRQRKLREKETGTR